MLILIISILCVVNYVPGTYLTGTDNLHPEFNFGLNMYRSIFSVWQEYQGLGLLAGHAHASDLPHQVFLWLVSFILPNSFLRYFFTYSMLFLGTLGVYKLLNSLLVQTFSPSLRKRTAFLGALFYLLNLGTMQYFLTPFEPYSTFWGFLPWELYSIFLFLKAPSKKHAFFVAFVHFLAAPQAYVQTVFVVYGLCVAILFSWYFLIHKSKTTAKLLILLSAIIFCVNAYWLLPNLYFAATNVSVTQNAINNKINTERFFQQNKARGNLWDFALLRGFNYDFVDAGNTPNSYDYMMKAWRDYYNSPLLLVGYGFFLVVLLGLFRKTTVRPFLLGIFVLSGLVFLSDTPIIATINDGLRSLPLINQVFRNPFSKFIAAQIFVFSVLFAFGSMWLLELAEKKISAKGGTIVFFFLVFLLLLYSLPAFSGNLFAKSMHSKIPTDYFDVFTYFKTQDKNARIMNLPQGSYWGWGTYRWGGTGSGFLWYGIEQPILDRAFDVWSKEDEGYYWELWYALKKKDTELFNQVLQKYDVSFILFDASYAPSDANPFKTLYLQQDAFLLNNPHLKLAKRFGALSVYKVTLANPSKQNTSLFNDLPTATVNEPFANIDTAYQKLGNYMSSPTISNDYYFPFGSLFTNRFENEHSFKVTDNPTNITFTSKLEKGTYTLSYPSIGATEPIIPVALSAQQENATTLRLIFRVASPQIVVGGKTLSQEEVSEEVSLSLPQEALLAPLLVSVNNQDFFAFSLKDNEETKIGTTFLLNSAGANTIRLYSSEKAKILTLPITEFAPAHECTQKENSKTLTTSYAQGKITMQAKNTSVCSPYTQPLTLQEGQSLVQVGFDYQSSSDEYPRYCLSADDSYQCLNATQSYNKVGFSNKEARFSDFFEVNSTFPNPSFQLILESLDDQDKDKTKQISYTNASITTYPLLATITGAVDLAALAHVPRTIPLSLQKDTPIQVVVAKNDNSFSFPHLLDKNRYKKTATTADNLPFTGDYFLQEIFDNGKAIRVYAKNTYSHFWLKLVDSYANLGYLVTMKTRNTSGFPLSLNIYTPDEINKYVYTVLDKSPVYTTSHFILPPLYEFDRGMQILIMSNSVNRIPSVNDIKDISLYPIPYTFFTDIYLEKEHLPQSLHGQLLNTQIKSVVKENPSLYSISLQYAPKNVLVLSQAYQRGWKAYRIDNPIQSLFPFLGTELKDRVRVNNWELGWIMHEKEKNARIDIVFLPQYLEYIGFFLLGLTGIIILLFRKPHANGNQPATNLTV